MYLHSLIRSFIRIYALFWLFGVLSQIVLALPAGAAVGSTLDKNELVDIEKRGVPTQSTYDDLVRYAKYSSAAYQGYCPRALGNTVIHTFSDSSTSTQGYIARDDGRKEYIVAFRGSLLIENFLIDAMIIQEPLSLYGVTNPASASPINVHMGFQMAFNSIASQILDILQSELNQKNGYTVVIAGHSLGGALASLGSVLVKSNFPAVPLKLFTYGQPRTGNADYAQMVENLIGTSNIFRSVHTFDGVPTILATLAGYRHHGTEYWNFADPSGIEKIKICNGGEDSTCSDSIHPSTGINLAHPFYYGQVMALDPFLCI